MNSKSCRLFHAIALNSYFTNRIRIRQRVRKAGRHLTPDDIQDYTRKRQRLSVRINDFHITANRLLGGQALGSVIGKHDILSEDGYVSDEGRAPEDRGLRPCLTDIENTIIACPSTVTRNTTSQLLDLRTKECRLRRAKANDTLGHIRETLSGLSYQYINKVRQAKTTRDHLRAYDGIKLLTQEVSFYQQVYNRNSRALGICDPALRSRYPLLRRSDCTINTAIADVNARGQSQARLPWLWAAQDGWDGEDQPGQNAMLDNDRLLECECSPLVPWFWYLMNDISVYRVNWMRARAHTQRWEEELPRTEKEMEWTTRYFMYERDVWYRRLVNLREEGSGGKGHEAYCEQQISQWEENARLAAFQFRKANPDFMDPWVPIITPL